MGEFIEEEWDEILSSIDDIGLDPEDSDIEDETWKYDLYYDI